MINTIINSGNEHNQHLVPSSGTNHMLSKIVAQICTLKICIVVITSQQYHMVGISTYSRWFLSLESVQKALTIPHQCSQDNPQYGINSLRVPNRVTENQNHTTRTWPFLAGNLCDLAARVNKRHITRLDLARLPRTMLPRGSAATLSNSKFEGRQAGDWQRLMTTQTNVYFLKIPPRPETFEIFSWCDERSAMICQNYYENSQRSARSRFRGVCYWFRVGFTAVAEVLGRCLASLQRTKVRDKQLISLEYSNCTAMLLLLLPLLHAALAAAAAPAATAAATAAAAAAAASAAALLPLLPMLRLLPLLPPLTLFPMMARLLPAAATALPARVAALLPPLWCSSRPYYIACKRRNYTLLHWPPAAHQSKNRKINNLKSANRRASIRKSLPGVESLACSDRSLAVASPHCWMNRFYMRRHDTMICIMINY